MLKVKQIKRRDRYRVRERNIELDEQIDRYMEIYRKINTELVKNIEF